MGIERWDAKLRWVDSNKITGLSFFITRFSMEETKDKECRLDASILG